jgi:glutaminase
MHEPYTKKEISAVIQRLHNSYKNTEEGSLAKYIPELGKANPNSFCISITTIDGETSFVGDDATMFTMQSISKPLIFGLALETHGLDHVRSRVDVEPTGEPFDSIIRLDNESKKPFNPLVNTGAIAMTNLIKGSGKTSRQEILEKTMENYVGRKIKVDEAVYESEKITGHRNRAIAHLMLHFGMVEPAIDEMLDLYFRQCSFNVNAKDLSVIGATLANNGVNPTTKTRAIKDQYIKNILALMFTCGLYTYAGEWAFDVGIPAKSGVSGGIMAVVPGRMGIGIYSPLVDKHGNSVRGVRVCGDLSRELNLHSFARGSKF